MVGEILVTVAGALSVNDAPGLVTPWTVTVIGPPAAPEGTPAVMLVLLQLVMEVAVTPLNFTDEPAIAELRKPDPLSVT